jgi:hypothetical protein
MTAEDKSKNSELEKGPTEKQKETKRFIHMGNGLARTAAQSMSIRTGKTVIKNRKSTKTSAKTGVKNQMVRMSWMKTIFRSRSIAPNVIGKKIVCCS